MKKIHLGDLTNISPKYKKNTAANAGILAYWVTANLRICRIMMSRRWQEQDDCNHFFGSSVWRLYTTPNTGDLIDVSAETKLLSGTVPVILYWPIYLPKT